MFKQKCAHCRRKFQPERKTARFCRVKCRQNYNNRLKRELALNEWFSPSEVVEAARSVMGAIDLDPASCEGANRIVKAAEFYTRKEDGLKQPWTGRVWLNPPYSRFGPKFVERFAKLFAEGAIQQGVLLLGTHHLTTDWIGTLLQQRPIICLPPKRLQFSGSTERPAHGSVLLGIGVNEQAFEEAFCTIGQIWIPYRSQKNAA